MRAWVVGPKISAERLPIVVHLHGGGYAAGAPYQDFALFDRYLQARPCIFVVPQYRRSFQAPYPAALNDAYAALVWTKENAASLGGRSNQIFIMGESAGGGLTAALAMMARDRGQVNVAAQFPNYAMLDDRNTIHTALPRRTLTWSLTHNQLAWAQYLGAAIKDVPAYAAPARATEFSGLPPSYGFIGDNDLFLQENIDFFERLKSADVPARFKVFEGAYHGTELFAPDSGPGRDIWQFAIENYAHAIDNCFATQP
jgi:acetyl esterase/lipase